MNATDTEAGEYAARVRAALEDLPAGEREDLLADLADHLAEVAGEDEEASLDDRLGPPEAYAADLRAAAGLPVGRAGGLLRGRLDAWTQQRWARSTLEFLPELRPGWEVLRGVLLAGALAWWQNGPVVVLLLALLTVPASMILGRRSRADRRWRPFDLAATLLAVAAGILALAAWSQLRENAQIYHVETVLPADSGLGGVTNIHPYGPDGRPLHDVLLYDQDGRPLVLQSNVDSGGNTLARVPRYGADGRVVPNVFPQEQTAEDYALLDPNDGPVQRRVPVPVVSPPALAPR